MNRGEHPFNLICGSKGAHFNVSVGTLGSKCNRSRRGACLERFVTGELGGKRSEQEDRFELGLHVRKKLTKRLLKMGISERHLHIGDEVAHGVTGVVVPTLEA